MDHSPPHRLGLAGDFCIVAAAELRERLLAALAEADALEVDLAAVTEMDSAGVQLMLAATRSAAAAGKSLRFVAAAPAVVDILTLCNLADLLAAPGESAPAH